MLVCFSGSRYGMTPLQRKSVNLWLEEHGGDIRVAVHGDCVGADATFHELIVEHAPWATIYTYPVPGFLQAKCTADVVHVRRSYLGRNKEMVTMADCVLATPASMKQRTGGTWYVIRYANRLKVPLHVFVPGVDT